MYTSLVMSITIDSGQVILITCSERLIDGKQLRKNDKPDVDNKIVKVKDRANFELIPQTG